MKYFLSFLILSTFLIATEELSTNLDYTLSAICYSLLLILIFLAVLVKRFQHKQSEQIKKLQKHNKDLEDEVKTAITKERQKDNILIEQSRLASMGEMIEQIAHQWRQPLNEIALLNQNLYFKKQLGNLNDEDFEMTHEKIDINLQYMSDTIDDFRNYYKSNKEKEIYPLSSSIDAVLGIVEATLSYSNIEVRLSVKEGIIVHNVKNELQQVLLIILNNAKDALVINKIKNKMIHIELTSDEKYAYVKIADNGGGVSEDIRSKIFDPYFSTKFSSQGTGIGLYMSKIIIEKNMLGHLSIKNVNDGACFSVKIPLQ
jgi:signal transduction histidine kinase